jgi:arsenate reductase
MAEGWARHLKAEAVEAWSAGIETHGLNPRAVTVMAEVGVDISGHQSKQVDELRRVPFDFVITLCDHASETCPVFPGETKRIHVSFDDPPRLTREGEADTDPLFHYRRIRDEIKEFIEGLPENLVA